MSIGRLSLDSRLRVGLLLVHLALPVGCWFAVRIGRPRFLGLAFYLCAAVLLVDILLLLGRPSAEKVAEGVLDVRVPAILLVASAGVVALLGPGVPFYVGVTATLLLVILRELETDENTEVGWANVGLVCGTSVLLISSQVFTVAYFVNTPDAINHTTTAMVLRDGDFLSSIFQTRYFAYSAFHVLASTGMRFTRMHPRLFMAVLEIVIFQAALVAAFLFFRNWGQSRSLALVAVVFTSINTAFFHYSTVPHYQSLSFVLMCVFLALVGRQQWTARSVAVAAPVLITWIVTHHVSVLMAIALLGVPVGYLSLRNWRSRRETSERSTVFVFSAFCLMFGVYWALVTAKLREVLVWTFFTSSAAEGVPSDIYLVQSIGSIDRLLIESISFFVDSLHYSFLLALTCLGLLVIFATGRHRELKWQLVLLGFLPAAIIYFPNPVWIPLEGLIPFSRWRIMVLPFLMLVPAVGLRYGVRPVDGSVLRRAGVVAFTAALVFTMITSGVAYPALTDLAGIQKGSQVHLTGEELSAADFVLEHTNERQQVHSRSKLQVYFHQYAWAEGRPYREDQFRTLQASRTNRRLLTDTGLSVVSVEAFRTQGIYVQLTDLNAERYSEDIEVGGSIYASTYRWDRTNTSVVFTNGEVVIQHQ